MKKKYDAIIRTPDYDEVEEFNVIHKVDSKDDETLTLKIKKNDESYISRVRGNTVCKIEDQGLGVDITIPTVDSIYQNHNIVVELDYLQELYLYTLLHARFTTTNKVQSTINFNKKGK